MVDALKIAHATLTDAGVTLHVFTSCSASLKPHKTAYFELLQVLKAHRHEVDPDLERTSFHLIYHSHTDHISNTTSRSDEQTTAPSINADGDPKKRRAPSRFFRVYLSQYPTVHVI
jgi:hypothetical protein